MKKYVLFAIISLFFVSSHSAWAQYVKLTANDGKVSWIKIRGSATINSTNIRITGKSTAEGSIDVNTKGVIDLNEVWSQSDGSGTHYQVTSIGIRAFLNCSGLTSIAIPSSVTSIGDYAFSSCSGLTFIDIPSSVTSIGKGAFGGCSGLTSVVIPSSVASIKGNLFGSCTGLTSIVVESGNSVYDSRNNCNAIIETASNSLIAGCKNTKIPLSVTSIGELAFSGCGSLTSVNIPSSVTSIGNYAFSNCSGLTSIEIPSSVTSIGNYAFYSCNGLTSIEIPSSVTSIGEDSFGNCSGLSSLVVESGNPIYDSRNNCNAIIETASNTLIAGCKNTKIPSSVTTIGESAFYGCNSLTSITIPNSVTSIGNSAFYNCSGLTSIEIPSSVTSIGGAAFFRCSALTYFIIPSSVISIGYRAFYDCSGLASVVIPPSVTSIGEHAFNSCSGLTSITSYITDVFKTETNAFYGCDNATLYVPHGLVSTYRSTADWNRFNKIEEIPGIIALDMSCNNKGKVVINGGVQFTNDMGEVSVYDGMENTFIFQPNDNCELRQVLIDGLDVTVSVENNQLATKVHEGSKMIVIFDKTGYDVNGDGQVDISDVVKLVNFILGQ